MYRLKNIQKQQQWLSEVFHNVAIKSRVKDFLADEGKNNDGVIKIEHGVVSDRALDSEKAHSMSNFTTEQVMMETNVAEDKRTKVKG